MTKRRRGHLGILLAATLLAVGCQTTVVTSDGRPMPPTPRAARAVPESVPPDRMVLLHAQKAVDTDGNGYPDQIEVLCSLFADGFNASIEWDGAFAFELYRMGDAHRPDAKPIAAWRYETPAVEQARVLASYGPCYRFNLSLIEAGSERVPSQHGDLRGRFEPAGEAAAINASDEVRPVQVGGGR